MGDDTSDEGLAARTHLLLTRLEWAGGGGYEDEVCCPECLAVRTVYIGDPRPGRGMHESDCELAALLRDSAREKR